MKKLTKALISILTITFVLAGSLAALAEDGAAPADGAPGFGGLSTIIMVVIMVAIFYFMLIRPDSNRKKKQAQMRDSLAVGDIITTIGGMVGKVVSIDDEKITFETGEDRVRIQITKWAVSSTGKTSAEPS